MLTGLKIQVSQSHITMHIIMLAMCTYIPDEKMMLSTSQAGNVITIIIIIFIDRTGCQEAHQPYYKNN